MHLFLSFNLLTAYVIHILQHDIDESRLALVTMQTNDDDIFSTEPIYILFKM